MQDGPTSQVSLDRLRVDNVGSLLRPEALKHAYAAHEAGEIDDAALRVAQDEAITGSVAEQIGRGLPIVTDGEFRRRQFMESFGDVAGFADWRERQAAATRSRDRDRHLTAAGQHRVDAPSSRTLAPATEPLRLLRNRPLEEYAFTQALTDRPAKVSLIGPDRIFQTYDEDASRDVYPEAQQFLDAVVGVQRQIVAELVDAGCRYVHMDAPGYTAYVDPRSRERMHSRGRDPLAVMRQTIAAENAVIAGFPETTFGIHLCRGNERSHWHREGTYDAVAEELFGGLAHQRLLLEYDSERAGDFSPLRFVPPDKTVVLGLITTKNAELESTDELRRRIDDASRYVPVEQLALSPQCGFASTIEGNNLSIADQWAKLELMLEVAGETWG